MDFYDVERWSDLSTGLQLLDAALGDRGLALDPPSTAPGLDEDQLRSWEEANADRIRPSDDAHVPVSRVPVGSVTDGGVSVLSVQPGVG